MFRRFLSDRNRAARHFEPKVQRAMRRGLAEQLVNLTKNKIVVHGFIDTVAPVLPRAANQ